MPAHNGKRPLKKVDLTASLKPISLARSRPQRPIEKVQDRKLDMLGPRFFANAMLLARIDHGFKRDRCGLQGIKRGG